MKIFRILFLAVFIFTANVYASDIHANTNQRSRMCLSAYLAKKIRMGEVAFYYQNQMIGSIAIYGSCLDEIEIVDNGYFKDRNDFEEKMKFLKVQNNGTWLEVNKFTYHSC
jgi:hypothetical protein